jgi:penicillin G amidase
MLKKSYLLILVFILAVVLLPPAPATPTADAQSGETFTLTGLDGDVTVIYDSMGIPHIYADTPRDLFMAQGYVEASDRWWQMEWWRHQSAGRLAEIVGESAVGTDMFLRTMNFERAAAADLEVLSDETLTNLDAYVAGINTYLEGKTPSELALEYDALAEAGITIDVEPWDRLDSVRWFKLMALNLSGNFQNELERAFLNDVNAFLPLFLFPPYDFENDPVIVEPGAVEYSSASAVVPRTPTGLTTQLVGDVDLDHPYLNPFGTGPGLGSNSWVVSGDLTDSGLPYLANDPHLGIQMPSIWYEVGLHCNERNADCPISVVGVSFAGTPSIVIGHNHFAAWGFTNVGADVQDLYRLEINPDNPNQYMLDGEWVDFELVEETIAVNGSDDIPMTLRYSVWGPVVSEITGAPGDAVLALRWTAFEGNRTIEALFEFSLIESWDDFRAAAALFDVPSQNLVYADIEGNIGYQMPGLIPLRAEGHDPNLPADGTTSENDWQGYIPFEELPTMFNPEEGYIVTANNPVIGPDYPYHITSDWAYKFRAARIEAMLQNDADGVFTVEDMQRIQMDNYNMKADFLVPALEELTFEDENAASLVGWLAAWDRQNDTNSGEALLFEAFWIELMRGIFADDFGNIPGIGGRYWVVVEDMLEVPDNPVFATLWNDSTTPDVQETPTDIMTTAFLRAIERVTDLQGPDREAWSWGAAHIAHFRAQPLGQADPRFDPALQAEFNVQVQTSGGTSIVNANSFNTNFEVVAVPSMRQILIPGDWDRSLRINTVGQSGDPRSPHYSDQVNMWASGEYHPDWFSREAVEADATRRWTLVPGN